MVPRSLLAIVLCLLAACSQGAAESAAAPPVAQEPSAHPVSGLQVIDLTVTHGRKAHRFRVEVAGDWQAQKQGLMFRTEMGANEGMLFPMEPARPASFWMKNTVLSLDIIFIGEDRRILNIAANTVPYSTDSVRSEGKAGAVLELNAGRAAQLGIEPGDQVSW